MAFKLKFQGKGKNPYSNIVSKGLVTPAHLIEGPGDEKKKGEGTDSPGGPKNNPIVLPPDPKIQNRLQKEAQAAAEKAERVKLNPGDKGYDPTKEASYAQTGTADYKTTFTPEGNEWYANASQAERDAADERERQRIQDAQQTIYSYDEKQKPEPEIDYSYLDQATFGSGSKGYTKEGKPAFYGLQLMSEAGDQLRGEEDPMSRYLTQPELDYLTKKGKIGAIGTNIGAIDYRSGYDDFYAKYKPGSKAFQLGVDRGIIDETGKTIPLNPVKEELEQSKNLLSETGLSDKDDPYNE